MSEKVMFFMWLFVAVVDLIGMIMGNPASWLLVWCPMLVLLERLAFDAFLND